MSQIFDESLENLTNTENEAAQQMEQELVKYKKKADRWKKTAIGIIVAVILCIFVGLFLIIKVYPQIWNQIITQINLDKDKKSTELVHDNIYEDGIDGVLKDLEEVIDFPQHLMLKNAFNLHFAPDGTISSMDTMWYGYDERYMYVDSYLISYDRSKSDRIDVYFNGGTGDVYNEEKDVNVLFDALRVIPIEDAVSDWNEAEYGILYKGVRNWGYNTEGILYIDKEKRVDIPSSEVSLEITGPTVSVYCPKDESITPKRYIYCENNLREENIK